MDNVKELPDPAIKAKRLHLQLVDLLTRASLTQMDPEEYE